ALRRPCIYWPGEWPFADAAARRPYQYFKSLLGGSRWPFGFSFPFSLRLPFSAGDLALSYDEIRPTENRTRTINPTTKSSFRRCAEANRVLTACRCPAVGGRSSSGARAIRVRRFRTT